MSDRQKHMLRSSSAVAFATFLSRILGLVRVMFEALVLGGGVFASAWHLAFMIPNLFRRLLGEGALGTALIPVIVHREDKYGRKHVREDLTVVFAVLGAVLAGIVVIISGASFILRQFPFKEHVLLAFDILPILMPYALFICFIGVIGAILNSRRVFFLPALGALLLNIFLIGGMAWGYWIFKASGTLDMPSFLRGLSGLTLLSGLIQLVLMLWLLKHKKMFPLIGRKSFKDLSIIGELWHLVLPGMLGGAALQISFVIDRSLAAYLGPQAVPALTYTERLVDLPIGIFAVSLGAVLMANMSRSAAKKDFSEMTNDLVFGLRHVYFICVPMMIFVVLFREEIMRLMLMRGNFTESDLQETIHATLFYGLGIPAFCSLKVILPAFYARKEMRKPLFVSLMCIGVNIVLNLILMWPMHQGGIALATVISSMLNNSTLLFLLRKEGVDVPLGKLFMAFCRALIAAVIGAGVWLIYPLLTTLFKFPVIGNLVPLGIAGVIFCLLYFVISSLLGGVEVKEFLQMFLKRKTSVVNK